MIDIHNHILPRFDDGARDMAESVAMCRVAETDGIEEIVATPHWREGDLEPSPDDIRHAVDTLNEKLAAKDMKLRIHPGMEARIDPCIPDRLADGRIMSLNGGRYLLMEFHPVYVPAGVENLIERVGKMGHGIILGHPERNHTIQENPRLLYRLVSIPDPWDVLVQITADSLTGQAGRAAAKTARALLKSDLAHIISSDAHSPFVRAPRLSEALIVAAAVIGKDKARALVREIPHAVVHGGDFPEFRIPKKVGRARPGL